jgi:hypothetical protein
MRIWYYVPPGTEDSIDATSTRAALGIYMAAGAIIVIAIIAIVAFGVWVVTDRTFKIDETVLKALAYVLAFIATFNGFTIAGGWLKQREAPKVAEAEVKRADAAVQKAVAAKLTNGDAVTTTTDGEGRTTIDVDPKRGLDDDGKPL